MAKIEPMKAKNDGELLKLLTDSRKDLREQRFSAAGARPKDTNAPRKAKKLIARILTEQRVRATAN